jgi:tRNA(Arg) A34 adenosine deaminase TadA
MPVMVPRALTLSLPSWVGANVARWPRRGSDQDRMRRVIALSRANANHGSGGPFAAAVFEIGTGKLVAVGVNSVTRLRNSALHAEVMALMLAHRQVGAFSLREPAHELFTSCEPCAMCLGAVLWSGVRRVVCGAGRADANRIAFDEGPVFPASYRYLRARGITIVRHVCRAEARAVLNDYRARGGHIYNG